MKSHWNYNIHCNLVPLFLLPLCTLVGSLLGTALWWIPDILGANFVRWSTDGTVLSLFLLVICNLYYGSISRHEIMLALSMEKPRYSLLGYLILRHCCLLLLSYGILVLTYRLEWFCYPRFYPQLLGPKPMDFLFAPRFILSFLAGMLAVYLVTTVLCCRFGKYCYLCVYFLCIGLWTLLIFDSNTMLRIYAGLPPVVWDIFGILLLVSITAFSVGKLLKVSYRG